MSVGLRYMGALHGHSNVKFTGAVIQPVITPCAVHNVVRGKTEINKGFIAAGVPAHFSARYVGFKGFLYISFPCTITKVTVLAADVGSIVIDIWKRPYSTFPPVVANSITGAAPPTITSGQKYQDSVLAGWTTAFGADDVLAIYVMSSSAMTNCTLSLTVLR